MKTSDFNFDLPEELIAQTPIEPRDHSRLMVLDKATGAIEHRTFTILSTTSPPRTAWCSTIPVCCPPASTA